MSPAFDPLRLFETLDRHGVHYVVIGGFAGRIWGSPTVTNDLDVCYDRESGNLERLAQALRDLGARLRGADEEVPFLLDARTLAAGDHFTLTTAAGNLDILGHPAGSGGYASLADAAQAVSVEGRPVKVAAIEDLIAMKRATGRPKDRVEVEILEAVREERERGG